MVTDWLLRIGNGINFRNSSKHLIWGINSKFAVGKFFVKEVKAGDRLWFVLSKTHGKILAVSTFTQCKDRELGPLVNMSLTNDELGWNKQENKDQDWNVEIHYKELYNLEDCDLVSNILGVSTIRKYNPEKCKLDLPNEYLALKRYLQVKEKF
jgi:hypothetical protein